MSRNSLPINIRSVSELEYKVNTVKRQLGSELFFDFGQELENLFREQHILIKFHDRVELSMFSKEADLVENVFSYPMDKKEIRLGKAPDNDIVIIERYISRDHAVFKLSDKGVFLTDNGSTNGTYINGVKINADDPQLLSNEDILHFGAQKIKFCIKKEISDDININASCSVDILRNSPQIASIYKAPVLVCRSVKNGKRVICEFDRHFFYDIINSLLGFGDAEGFVYEKPVTRIEEGVFLYLFTLVLDRANKVIMPDDNLLVFEKPGTAQDLQINGEYIRLGLCINANNIKYAARIYIEGDTLEIRDYETSTLKSSLLDLLSSGPGRLDLVVGETSLSYEEIKSINNQSILIMDKWYLNSKTPEADDIVIISQPDTCICFNARISSNMNSYQAVIEQIFKKENLEMEEFDAEKNKTVGSLDTTVYVVLASKQIALSDLSKIKKGDIIDFDNRINNKVSLIINKHVFAKGELIEYEGKIGVEITDVLYQ